MPKLEILMDAEEILEDVKKRFTQFDRVTIQFNIDCRKEIVNVYVLLDEENLYGKETEC